MTTPNDELTPEEIALLEGLGDCWNQFCQLPAGHPADAIEFSTAIHVLQNMIMARLAVRRHPEIFPHSGGSNDPA